MGPQSHLPRRLSLKAVALFFSAAFGLLATVTTGALAQEELRPIVRELRTITDDLRAVTDELMGRLPGAGEGAEVHGQVTAGHRGARREYISIPDVEVYVENIGTTAVSDPVLTNLGGVYIIPNQPPGIYRVCWRKTGWRSECADATFEIAGTTAYPGRIFIRPEARPNAGILLGRVAFADGGSCWFDQEFFGLEETATVELVELVTGTTLQTVRGNDHGEFVLTDAPTDIAFQVRTRCGDAVKRDAVFPNLVDLTGGTPFAVTISNRTPTIRSIFALQNGDFVRRAGLGETVEIRAEAADPDGDALAFDWRVIEGSGSLDPSTFDTVKWTLPDTPGRHNLYVVASDGRGGRGMKRFAFDVGVPQVVFGGTILGDDGPPVAEAVVSVNGASTRTDATGAFQMTLEPAKVYVLHIDAEGYVELGRRLELPVEGGAWVLTRAFAQPFDPEDGVTVVDGREDWIRPDPDQDPDARPRRPSRLTIPGGALVREDGVEPSAADGPYTVYFATIDTNTEVLPGDYGARTLGGEEVFMTSFGAAFVNVRDASGRRYRLRDGATALLEGAIQFPQLSNATPPPPEMGVFVYEPETGLWREREVVASLAGDMYEVELPGFSTTNFDQAKPNPACLRVNVDQGILDLGDVVARVDVATGTDSVERREGQVDAFDNVFYNMPVNAGFAIEVFQGAPPNDALIFADIGNTGAPWGGTGIPPAPYTDCNAEVVLNFPTTPPAFLQYGKGTGSQARAEGYYGAIDPDGLRLTLGDWWGVNGFDATDGSGGVRTSFLNHNDLGFGRDMHCRTAAAIGAIGDPVAGDVDVACYVTNYGEPDQELGNANLAQVADQNSAIATVAMEYSAVEDQNPDDRIVKFYVFGGGNAAAPRATAADLDKAGPKFVPNLCLVCHGGNYNPADEANPTFNEINVGASFREFDTHSFRYPSTNPQAAQEPAFLEQNTVAYHSKPAPAILELIEAFYASGPTVDANAVPDGWASPGDPQEQLYLDVVGRSCRTCHVAQPGSDPLAAPQPVGTYPDWATYEIFRDNRTLSYALVCSAKQMPNALVTFKNFWLSLGPHRPEAFEDFSDASTGWTQSLESQIGPCDP